MRPILPVRIAGLGRYLPERVVLTEEIAARLGVDAESLVERTGVRERRVADRRGRETASRMGALAAREALEAAGIEPSSLDLIVNASGTVEQAIPDGGALIQRELGLGGSGIASMSVQATCLSFLAALQLAAPAIAIGRYRRVLVVSSDITAPGIDSDDVESAALFGDGAAAAVLASPEDETTGIVASRFATYGRDAHLAQIEGGGSRAYPDDEGVGRAEQVFKMRGPELLKRVLGRARPFLNTLLKDVDDSMKKNVLVVPHQASAAGLRLLEALGFDDARVVTTLDSLGNCVAASIPLTLYHAVATGRLVRGDPVLLLGTGAGLSMGGVLLRY